METPVTLARLGSRVGLSVYHLQRTFKRILGITPRQYADALRLGRWKTGLQNGQGITQALYDAGYGSSSRLYERAAGRLGMTPATYRRGGQGIRIDYTIVDCSLGRLLVAATERGICAVRLGDSDPELVRSLTNEYPNAEIQHARSRIEQWVNALLEHLDGEQPSLKLPVDVQATAFQWRVWEELRSIPCGATRSYGEIARMIGRPKAARAVARACATNPVAIVVPCHRVVREDGGLGGYRWGAKRKQALLKIETEASASAPSSPRATK
jgi:AraC family transcriptional regulator of adaptative response/methylated-DNA-[protein]-cysteine methyltransferase